jgi:hypothetical protein
MHENQQIFLFLKIMNICTKKVLANCIKKNAMILFGN